MTVGLVWASPASAQTPLPFTSLDAYVASAKAALPAAGSNAFIEPPDAERTAFAGAIADLFAGRVNAAMATLVPLGYQLGTFLDAADTRTYLVAFEQTPTPRGLGTYIVATTFTRHAVVEVPHPINDTRTPEQGARITREIGARALFIAGTHRCANLTQASPCSGTTGVCSIGTAPFRVSDVAHYTRTFFQAAHQATLSLPTVPIALNTHGNSSEVPDVEISDGTNAAAVSSSLVNRLRTALGSRSVSVASCNWPADNPGSLNLCGTTNVQGRLSNGSSDPCSSSAVGAGGQFLHIEQHLNIRDNPAALIEALKEVLPLAAPPVVVITTPTSDPTTTATSPFLTIGGPVTGDNTIAGIGWVTDRGKNGTGTLTAPVVANAFPDAPADTRTWQADIPLVASANLITVTATDAIGLTGTDTLTSTVSTFVYSFAEGATGPFFDLELALGNPNGTAAPVDIQYLKEDGTTVSQSLSLAARSRQTVFVDGLAGLTNTAVSAVVSSLDALPLAVERTMTWDATGYGSHTEKATPGARLAWYFAEGSEQGFFDTYLLLANPQATANRASVQFLVEGGSPVTRVYDLLPTSRTNVFAEAVTDALGTPVLLDKAFGIVVTFDQPGVAERAMYFGTSPFWNGGHESAGVNAPSSSWFHAEGATGPFFDTFILLSNPNPADATVTLTFLLGSGTTVVRTKTVPANARLTVNVEGEDPLLASAAMATQVTSDVPIVSERAMYWAAHPNWYEAHNSFGVTATATTWALGEGRVGGPNTYETYILLANPGTAVATVTVTYLREGGLTPVAKTYTVAPTSRFTIYVNAERDGGGSPIVTDERFGALLSSTMPIVVERAMYSNAASQPGVMWAAGTSASATRIP